MSIRGTLFSWKALAAVLLIAIVVLAYMHKRMSELEAQNIALIHDIKITMADAEGSNLPPAPDKQLNDATLEGIDANKNFIRDDVELAIFAKYPREEDLKLRAALLQYAQALQKSLLLVVWKESWKEQVNDETRAYVCLTSNVTAGDSDAVYLKKKELIGLVQNTIFNTEARAQHRKNIQKFESTSGDTPKPYCDISV